MMNTEWERLDSRFSCVLAMRRFFCPAQTPHIPTKSCCFPTFPPLPALGCEGFRGCGILGRVGNGEALNAPRRCGWLHPWKCPKARPDGADPMEFPCPWIRFKVLGCGSSPEFQDLPLQKTSKASSVDLTSTSVQPVTYMLWFWSSRRILDWGGLWESGKEGNQRNPVRAEFSVQLPAMQIFLEGKIQWEKVKNLRGKGQKFWGENVKNSEGKGQKVQGKR